MKIKNKELPRNVILLGIVSFLTDVSTEMILPVLPLFFVSIGVEKAIIGLIEGVAESTASLLKVFSGYYSDKIGKRKIFITSGYGLSTISKLLFAFVTTWQQALVVRFTERVGKGIRTSPRDAIIADSVKEETRGKWFGFHRAMDTTGAIIGSLIAFLIISYISYRKLFIISFIPALVAVILTLFVKEKEKVKKTERKKFEISLASFDRRFKKFLLIAGLFALANFSYAFFILRASDLGASSRETIFYYVLFNVVYALLAMPFGQLSDKYPRKYVISAGYFIFGITCLGFAFATSKLHALLFFIFYGIFSALIEGNQRAFVADLVSERVRGTAYGMFNTIVGIATLPASILAGALWQYVGVKATFLYGFVLAFLSGMLLLSLK